METFIKKQTEKELIGSILFAIVGLVLWTNPLSTLAVITYVIELLLIVTGILSVIDYIKFETNNYAFSFGFVKGIICILLALFLIINPKFIASILPVIIGIWMIAGSIARIQLSLTLSSLNSKRVSGMLLFAIITLTLGVVIVFNPFTTAAIMIQVLGATLTVYSVIDIIQDIQIIKYLK